MSVQQSAVEDVRCGDMVFYKRNDCHRWQGPATVGGIDGRQVMVKHGGSRACVHAFKLQHHNGEDFSDMLSGPKDGTTDGDNAGLNVPPIEMTKVSGDDEEVGDEPPVAASLKPRIGMHIGGVRNSTGEYFTGKIVSRAGKATGKYNNCFNVKADSDNTISLMDFNSEFDEWRQIQDSEEVLVCSSSEEIDSAKKGEINNWIANSVFEEVEDNGQRCLSTRWIITEKIKQGKRVVKARLVVQGFEEDTCSIQKDSPTCTKESIRIGLSIMSSLGWSCHSIDISAAFLQGDVIEREVYVLPAPEFYNGKIWKLKKTVYGLSDAARAWYARVRYELLRLNMKISSLDPALFFWKCDGKLAGRICLHVDDFFWSGTPKFQQDVIAHICSFLCRKF